MYQYTQSPDYNISNNKVSIIFWKTPYSPRNEAEMEALEIAYKAWKVWRMWSSETKVLQSDITDIKELRDLYLSKVWVPVPNLKKNNADWIKAKLLELNKKQMTEEVVIEEVVEPTQEEVVEPTQEEVVEETAE